MVRRIAICLWLTASSTAGHAQQFVPPEYVTFAGKTYQLAYKNALPDGKAIFEYTSNNEPVENWSSLVTINYSKSFLISPTKWGEAMKASLDRRKPRPHYSLYTKENNSYARIIFEPDAKDPTYESNIQKSFHIEACGGLVVYQFAQKYPPGSDQSAEGRLSTLKTIVGANTLATELIEKSDWFPACN